MVASTTAGAGPTAGAGAVRLATAAAVTAAIVSLSLVVAPRALAAEELVRIRENPFEDIPKGHPAYAAIERLVRSGLIEGFPDGTFKGDKVITRYDLALMMARAMGRIEDLKAQGRPVSAEEQQLIDKLTREVGVELGLFGVRLDSLERRVATSEGRADRLELLKSNVSLGGFYRLENSFVFRPVNYSDYPFVREVDPFFVLRDRGLIPMRQEVFLRFSGRPVLDGLPVKSVDAFAEVRGLIVGNGGLHPTFGFSPNPARTPTIPGDLLDDFATSVQDDARVFFNRAHFLVRTKRMNFRAFANESATDLTDPNVLFTVDTLPPFSGLEANGGIKKLSYTTSVMRDIQLRQPTGIDPRDITRFEPESKRTSDVYTMRLTYEPNKGDPGSRGRSWLFGGTFVEHPFRYDLVNDFFRTLAWDVQYVNHRNGRLDAIVTFLHSQGRSELGQPDLLDTAFKLDSSYVKDGFVANLKVYSFGSDFRTDVAQNQFVDSDVSFNFHRAVTRGLPDRIAGLPDPANRGEQLLRLQLKNEWQGRNLKSIRNLILSALWEIKSWQRDPRNPLMNDDENASRFYIQALTDITRRWHVELFSEIQKDARIDTRVQAVRDSDETGTINNTFRSDWRIQDNLSFITEFQLKDDLDSLDSDGRHFKMIRQKYELPWQAHRRFFLKGTFEKITNSDLQLVSVPITPINERNLGRQVYEMNWVILPKWALKVLWVTQITRNNRLLAPSEGRLARVEDNNTNIAVFENVFNFTPALKLRYIYQDQNTNLFVTGRPPLFLSDIVISNNFAELIYTPSPGSELRLSYGYEFENPNDPFDNGPAKFWRTEQIIQVKAQTDF
jgi:hypothetical protein